MPKELELSDDEEFDQFVENGALVGSVKVNDWTSDSAKWKGAKSYSRWVIIEPPRPTIFETFVKEKDKVKNVRLALTMEKILQNIATS